MFDAYDLDGDGFVTQDDWKGPKAIFASLDTDKDGILARHEVVGCGELTMDPMVDLDDEEAAMLAEMEQGLACGDVMASDKEAKKGDDEDDDEGSGKEGKKAGRGDGDGGAGQQAEGR